MPLKVRLLHYEKTIVIRVEDIHYKLLDLSLEAEAEEGTSLHLDLRIPPGLKDSVAQLRRAAGTSAPIPRQPQVTGSKQSSPPNWATES